jgi:hypothetical protein
MEFFRNLFSSGDFMPHGFCYMWRPGLLWLHVVSDGLIALAYFSIPFTLIYFIRKRRDVPFNWIFVCFGLFILACGATHAMEIWTLWHAIYWLAVVSETVNLLDAGTLRGQQPSPLQSVSLPASLVRVKIVLPRFNAPGRYEVAVTRDQAGNDVQGTRHCHDD